MSLRSDAPPRPEVRLDAGDPERSSVRRRWLRPAVSVVALWLVAGMVGFALLETSGLTDERAVGALVTTAAEAGGKRASEPLPSARLQPLGAGSPVALSDYRGLPLVVNFWASWCGPCLTEMPELQAVAEAGEGEVALVGINVQDAPANATRFASELGISYDLLVDPDASLFTEIGGFGLPTTLLVDSGGTIVYRHVGIMDHQETVAALAEHLRVELD